MARILLDESEIEVDEEVDQILAAIVNAKDGLRGARGQIVAPPGWVRLTQPGLGETIYIQVSHIGCVRED